MDVIQESKRKKGGNLIIKTWERCKSLGRGTNIKKTILVRTLSSKSKSWPRASSPMEDVVYHRQDRTPPAQRKRGVVAPEGCFSIYVGPQKQRFVIKTECVNHPLFQLLLEEAETEYGYNPEGPLVLPCNVDIFYKVLFAMDDISTADHRQFPRLGCTASFLKNHGSYQLLSPSRMISMNQF